MLAYGVIIVRFSRVPGGAVLNGDFLIGTWLVQPTLNTVSANGASVRLEPKVMAVLVCLAARPGEPVSKQELLNTVWADAFVTEDVLSRSISELRRVFDDDSRQPKFIQTIPKRGYRLVASVEAVNRSIHETTVSARRPVRKTWFSIAGAIAVLLIFGVLIFKGNSSADWPAGVANALNFPVQGDAQKQGIPLGTKDGAPNSAPKVALNRTPKRLHADPVLKESPVTVVTVFNNTNIAQSEGTVVDSQSPTGKTPPRTESLFQNISPDVVRTRIKHAVLPIYPAAATQAHVTGTVEIGMAVSPAGEVYSVRILIGHPLLVQSAMEAMRQWRFEPNQVQGVFTWSRMRALVRFLPDGTTAVAFGPPILVDDFGDLGSQRDELRDAAILPVIPSAQ